MQEEFILFSDKTFRKIKVPKVLNWDSTGYPEKNIVNVSKDERSFKLLMKENPQLIRIALHPRDPHQALKDQGYKILSYMEVIPKLQEL